MNEKIVDKMITLEKMKGKGGWTFARISGIKVSSKKAFGFVRVKGSIDDININAYNLMPISKDKGGGLFLPLKAEIRKKIKKEEGDTVHIILYRDEIPDDLPIELEEILKDEKHIWKKFNQKTQIEKSKLIEWIYSSKTEEEKANKIATLLNELTI